MVLVLSDLEATHDRPPRRSDRHVAHGLGGGTETSTARVDGEGAWRFGSHSAYAVLRVDADAGHAEATWFRVLDDGPREWMRLHFTRERD